MTKPRVVVVGAGVLGLWQAYELSRRGFVVALREALPEAVAGKASRLAGAMLAPYCEAEDGDPLIEGLGLNGIRRWREAWPDLAVSGTLVVAQPRDQVELVRFARRTHGHVSLDDRAISTLEGELAGRFQRGLV